MPERRARGWKDAFRPSASQLIIALLLGALAFGMVVQIRGTTDAEYTGLRQGELVELLKSLDSANERVSDEIDELTSSRDKLRGSTQKSEAAQEQLSAEIDELGILAGTVAASGPGVKLTIGGDAGNADAALILDAVEELRDAGAEVIAINGVARVVAQTYFLDEDGGIRVGGREVEGPYVIEAIGEPSTMVGALEFPGGFLDKARDRDVQASVETSASLDITALADQENPEYAQPST